MLNRKRVRNDKKMMIIIGCTGERKGAGFSAASIAQLKKENCYTYTYFRTDVLEYQELLKLVESEKNKAVLKDNLKRDMEVLKETGLNDLSLT